jgi:hypothetical protein
MMMMMMMMMVTTMMMMVDNHDDDVGTISERKQLFSDELVNHCQYDVYLTTYDTLIIEEAFFTDSWPWVTVTIDEGHRIKNENAKLRLALSRLRCPFRLLLTGRWYSMCWWNTQCLWLHHVPSYESP